MIVLCRRGGGSRGSSSGGTAEAQAQPTQRGPAAKIDAVGVTTAQQIDDPTRGAAKNASGGGVPESKAYDDAGGAEWESATTGKATAPSRGVSESKGGDKADAGWEPAAATRGAVPLFELPGDSTGDPEPATAATASAATRTGSRAGVSARTGPQVTSAGGPGEAGADLGRD